MTKLTTKVPNSEPQKDSVFDDNIKALVTPFYLSARKNPQSLLKLISKVELMLSEDSKGTLLKQLAFHASPRELESFDSDLANYNVIFEILDRSFGYLTYEHLDKTLARLLERFGKCCLKLALVDVSFIHDKFHIVRQYLNLMVADAITLNENQSILRLLKENLTVTINKWAEIRSKQETQILIELQLGAYQTRITELNRRAQIFERRTLESEQGHAKNWAAKFWAKRKMAALIENQVLPDFIHELLLDSWLHLVYIEKLKSPDCDDLKSVRIAKCLITSISHDHFSSHLDKLSALQSLVLIKIRNGLENSPLSGNEASRYIELIQDLHREVLFPVYKNSQVKSIDSNQNGHGKSEEKIIRLAPFDDAQYKDVTEMSQKKVRNFTSTELELWGVSLWKDKSEFNSQAPLVEDLSQHKSLQAVVPGSWFRFKATGTWQKIKFCGRIEANSTLLFVNLGGVKAECFSESKAIKLIESGELIALEESRLVETSFSHAFDYVHQIQKLKLERENLEREIQLKKQQERENEKKAKQEFLTENRQALIEAKRALNNLAIGAWVEFIEPEQTKKCRVAARFSTKNEMVLVDRNGFKYKQTTVDRLAIMVVKEKLKLSLDNDLFSVTLR
ncbi:MAG: DUF1631 domain-containing protein [Kangiellaceae bacterium]|nr:DUF1631 domain-containing protein [Kangiellaceae bacterium]MCW8998743.1 DUF1631 domain-containing protein [Kangiellaceae bacterium]MCW9015502.1 DUF1631 domain-containing protein [Kangiellaceae bacterium]